MRRPKLVSLVRTVLLALVANFAVDLAASSIAEARVGGGRSSGRSSGYGSRSHSAPSHQPGSSSTPHYSSPYGAPQTSPNPALGANPNRGGFWRGMAGGLAGGFLGSMLFSSLGRAAGVGGAGGGGIGLLEILLLAGLAYLGFRWWKSRQQQAMATPFGGGRMNRSVETGFTPAQPVAMGGFRALAPAGIDPEIATDLFFKVQGAWTRRDLTSVRPLLADEMRLVLERDLEELRQARQINRLENITVRKAEVVQSWEEGGREYSAVRFTANLLDYAVDEATGQVVQGSDREPVKFAEEWIFAKQPVGTGWELVGIQQMS